MLSQIVFAEQVLCLFGVQYTVLAPLLQIATILTTIGIILHTPFTLLYYTGLHVVAFKIELAQILTSMILMLLFANYLGAYGVLLSSLSTRIISSIFLCLKGRQTGVKTLVAI